MYQVIVGDRHDTRYKAMMNNLMKSVFGFTFERWYARDLWNEGYECYSVVYDGRLISNVSMTKMTLLVAGHRVPAIQLGAVATLPEYRGLGLSRRIMEHILDKYLGTPAFLFANKSVLEFYPKFGFEPVMEVQPYMQLQRPLPGGMCSKLSIDSPILAHHVGRRHHFSAVLDALDAESVNWFHILMEFEDAIYHIPHMDIIVIATQEGDTVTIYDVLGDTDVPLLEIIQYLPFQGCDTVDFAFMPDALGCDYMTRKMGAGGGSGYLFCKELDLKKDFKFPYMAIT
mgnify:FL=1